MHQVESPCIDSIVLDTPWKRRSNDASSAALELRAPWPLAAPEPAAIFPPLLTDGDRCLLAPDAQGAPANDGSKHAPISEPFQNKLFCISSGGPVYTWAKCIALQLSFKPG